jgi:hypothetical protein
MLPVTLPIRAAAMVVVAPESVDPPLEPPLEPPLDPPLDPPEPPQEEPPLEPPESPELPVSLEPPESPAGAPESGWDDEELLLQANSGEAAIDATTREVMTSEWGFMGAPR